MLVLDDLHEVRDPVIHADLELLLEYAPDRLRLVVCTRSDPPLRLQRLRLSGRLAEVRAADLAFTLDEAGRLLDALGISLGDSDLELLWRRTEGWAAALRLAAFSLEGEPTPRRSWPALRATIVRSSDYLLAEVVSRQPADKFVVFLMRTSIVERISGGLADALTELGAGEAPRSRSSRAATACSSQPKPTVIGTAYHGMLAEVLKRERARRLPGEASELHRRFRLARPGGQAPIEPTRPGRRPAPGSSAGDLPAAPSPPLRPRRQGGGLADPNPQSPRTSWTTRLPSPPARISSRGCTVQPSTVPLGRYELAPRLSAARRRRFDVHSDRRGALRRAPARRLRRGAERRQGRVREPLA